MRRSLSLLMAALLIALPVSPSNSATSDGCKGSIWDTVYPNECIIDVHDGAQTIAGIAITENVYKCSDTAYGIVLSSGYDGLGWIKVKSASPSGELAVGSVDFELWFIQQCLSWKDAYAIKLTMIGPDGKSYNANFKASEFSYRKKYSGSVNSYCFSNICGDTRIQGNFSLPETAPSGSYQLVLEVKSNWQYSSANKTFTYSNQLFLRTTAVSPSPSPSPTATPSTNPSTSSSGMVNEGEFSICGGDLRETLSAIKGFDKKLHPAHKKRIKDAMNAPKDICGLDMPVASVVCEGVYYGGAAAAKVAKGKATMACNHAKTIQKYVPTLIKVKSTKSKSYNGFVYVTFSFE